MPQGLDRRTVIKGIALGSLLPPGLARAAGRRPAIVSPLAFDHHRLWIAAAIDGRPKPYLFVIDTGTGFSMIRPGVARELGLTVVDGYRIGGIGGRQAQGTRYAARDVLFGGTIRQADVVFDGYDFGTGMPPDAAGLLSAGLFATRDSDIDFQRGEWRLWPDGRPDRAGLERLPATITGTGTPRVRLSATAFVDGRAYRFILDTGDPGDILLFPPAARRSGLFADDLPFAPETTGGFGGRAARMSRRVRAKAFQFGPLALDRPLVTVMDPGGAIDMNDHDGLIGIEMLRLLTLSTDVRGAALWGGRNTTPAAIPTYRRAGLWLDRTAAGTATVAMVGTGSPAAQAGVRAGDAIVRPATFEAAIAAIGGPAGRPVSLGLMRDGTGVDVRYTLADYL